MGRADIAAVISWFYDFPRKHRKRNASPLMVKRQQGRGWCHMAAGVKRRGLRLPHVAIKAVTMPAMHSPERIAIAAMLTFPGGVRVGVAEPFQPVRGCLCIIISLFFKPGKEAIHARLMTEIPGRVELVTCHLPLLVGHIRFCEYEIALNMGGVMTPADCRAFD